MDLLTTVTVVAIVAAIAGPTMSNDEQLHLLAASSIVRSDIELAQVMTIAYPSDPIVVRFDTANNTYWLARTATPDTPIARSDNGEDYVVVLGSGRAAGASGVALAIDDAPSDTIALNSLGGIDDLVSSPAVTLTTSGRWMKLTLAPTTGSIIESGGAGAPPG